MGMIELYYFSVDALVKVVTKDPICIPLRRFFDREVRVFSTKECYDAALDTFLEDKIVREDARIFFSNYLDKVEIVNVDLHHTMDLMKQHSLDQAGASLIAAMRANTSSGSGIPGYTCFLVTSDARLIAAAQNEGMNFHDYTQEAFCEKYES